MRLHILELSVDLPMLLSSLSRQTDRLSKHMFRLFFPYKLLRSATRMDLLLQPIITLLLSVLLCSAFQLVQ